MFIFLFLKFYALHLPLKLYLCRSSLINSPVEIRSTENVINWTSPETTRDRSENSIEVVFLSHQLPIVCQKTCPTRLVSLFC